MPESARTQIRPASDEEIAALSCASPFSLLIQDYITAHGGSGIFMPSGQRYAFQQVPLAALLTSAVTTAKDRYAVPLDYIFLVTSIRGHLLPVKLSSDTFATNNNSVLLSPQQARTLRAQNCRVQLQNISRTQFLIGPRGNNGFDACLADLYEAEGGGPVVTSDLGVSALVGPGESLELAVTLQDTTAGMENTNGAQYGVLVGGLLIYLGPSNRAKT